MKIHLGIIAFFITVLSITQVNAQNDANVLLRLVYSKLQKAKDYTVQAHIKVDMPFIRMVPTDVKIYFKQKDKFKVVSKGIAIVPRQGFDQASKMLADTISFTVMIQGNEKLGTIQTKLLNVIPLADTSDMILGKFWIDPLQNVIVKSQLTTRSNGTIVTEYTYGNQVAYGLPDEMIFLVDVKKFKVPKGIASEPVKNDSDNKDKVNGNKKGKIYITLSNYQVNKGIPDSMFKK
jgi:hypothetical protein